MGLQADSVLWNKCEDAALVSEIGVNGVNGGATFPAGKFGNGAQCNANAETFYFVNQTLNLDECLFECWLKTEYNIVNGEPADAVAHDIFNVNLTAGAQRMRLIIYPHATLGIFLFRSSEGNTNLRDLVTDVTAGTWFHFIIVISRSASFDGANTLGIYIDGVQSVAVNQALASLGSVGTDIFMANTSAVATAQLDGILDNPKFYIPNTLSMADLLAAVIANKDNEGWPSTAPAAVKKIWSYEVPAYEPPAPTPKLFAPVRSRVEIIGDTDIYKLGFIDNIGNITESRSFRKDKMVDNEIRIPCDNKALAFSPGNSKSLFNGTNWYFSQVKIWDEDNIQIWDGLLWDIVRNSQARTASLVSRSVMSRIKNIKVAYESSDYETGADALMNIFAAAEFTNYNQRTFQESAATLTAAGALMYLKVTAEDNMSMQNIIAKVAEYCAADAYGHLGEIYMKVWKKITASGSVPILEKDILKQPVTQSAMSEIINTFSIGYSGDEGTPATDEDNNNIGSVSRRLYGTRSLPELSTGDENQIVFPTLASAVWIGEQYIKRTHRNIDTTPLPLIMSRLSVDGRLKNFIDLESILGLTYSDEGFSNETMEPFHFVRNNDRNIVDLVLYTAAS